jgi:uncharacterized protein (TIGR03067 family)
MREAPMHWQLLSAVLVLAAPAPAEDKKDAERLQGEWTAVSFRRGTIAEPGDDDVKKFKVVIKDDLMTINDGKRDEKLTIRLGPTKKLKEIDLTPQDKGAEAKVLGIYELNGDDLKICFTKAGGARPTKFAWDPDAGQTLIVFKRQKKDK